MRCTGQRRAARSSTAITKTWMSSEKARFMDFCAKCLRQLGAWQDLTISWRSIGDTRVDLTRSAKGPLVGRKVQRLMTLKIQKPIAAWICRDEARWTWWKTLCSRRFSELSNKATSMGRSRMGFQLEVDFDRSTIAAESITIAWLPAELVASASIPTVKVQIPPTWRAGTETY